MVAAVAMSIEHRPMAFEMSTAPTRSSYPHGLETHPLTNESFQEMTK
jgi:hypothetical protein